jgi:hypothetical protein
MPRLDAASCLSVMNRPRISLILHGIAALLVTSYSTAAACVHRRSHAPPLEADPSPREHRLSVVQVEPEGLPQVFEPGARCETAAAAQDLASEPPCRGYLTHPFMRVPDR